MVGDTVTDAGGRVEQVARFVTGGYLTTNDTHISRNDLKSGTYKKVPPTEPNLTEAQASAEMLIGLSEAGQICTYELLKDIAEEWTQEYKRNVWALLPTDLRERYTALRDSNDQSP